MNLRKTCPDIPDDWKGSITDVCRVLGDERPLSPKTVRKHILQLRQRAKGNVNVAANGRLQISGAEVKQLWKIL